jgi:hypothetical protein
MKKTIVHILSTSYAGSHYLSLLLGNHSQALHVGELFQLKRTKGMMLGEVYFTASPIFEGIGPHNIHDVYDIIFSRIDPHIGALVDTSKVLRGWTEMFVKDDRHHRKYVHLIRDPRALVRRWMVPQDRTNPLRVRWKLLRSWPQVPGRAAFGDVPSILMYRWLQQNRTITRFIGQHRLDANLVTYRDLAKDTAGEVRRLMEWIGLSFEPGQLEYWNREHIGTQKRKYEWVKDQKTNYFDLRWKTELRQEIQERIVADRWIKAYLDELGLSLTEEGLTLASGRNPYAPPA